MKTVLIVFAALFSLGAAAAQEAERWTCPMHPHYVADEFGTCPICGMDLVPVEADAAEGAVSVSPEVIQTMGVVTAPAAVSDFGRIIRAYGTVTANERTEAVVASRVTGWIEDLAVAAEGDAVEEGQLLYRLYSPDITAALADYRAAGGARRESARARLRSLGVQDQAIDTLSQSGNEGVPVFAEADGIVAELSVREGAYLRPGDPIMVLQNLSTVWISAAIEPRDLPFVEAGTPAVVTVTELSGPIETVVDYVHPSVDATTRTGEARLVLDNAESRLVPGAYADIALSVNAAPRLAVPTEAVLRDGRGAHVVVALGEGRFAPRGVRTGVSALGLTEITAGLREGENVVVSGQFLLDSEASLTEGLADYAPPAAVVAGPDTPLSELPLDQDALAAITHLPDAALYLHEALVDGYAPQPGFLETTIEVGETLRARYAGTRLEAVVAGAQDALRAAQSAESEAAIQAALATLMSALEPWMLEGAPARYEAVGLDLYRTENGRLWLQEGGEPVSPYGPASFVRVPWPEPMAMPEAPDPVRPRAAPLERDASAEHAH
ncbi:efflux RND transporter periplasmic adaptor subunit [Parvularcula oceani]|uniref:efflux RND transporter periplasmic adaptor subunit n=1 Tax=Parvularcula oceani TaxID=1247963 RepID=UPI00068F0072|nr:efflux RND transporter periplasmic adaptor subunit [Parvularcula oceani]